MSDFKAKGYKSASEMRRLEGRREQKSALVTKPSENVTNGNLSDVDLLLERVEYWNDRLGSEIPDEHRKLVAVVRAYHEAVEGSAYCCVNDTCRKLCKAALARAEEIAGGVSHKEETILETE